VVLPASHKVSRVSWYSGVERPISSFTYRAFTFYGGAFQLSSIRLFQLYVQSTTPKHKALVWALSISLAATQEIEVSFSSSGYLDVSVPRVYPYIPIYSVYSTCGYTCRFPHSEISGSQAICAYPKLIAAYHVLHRLLVPRHSPCALCSLIYLNLQLALLRKFVKSNLP
jgi:hypothetical protein